MGLKFINKKNQDRFDNIDPSLKHALWTRMLIAKRISDILASNGITQAEFAKALDKHESEISKWLSGTHNLTIDTVALIEFHLNKEYQLGLNCVLGDIVSRPYQQYKDFTATSAKEVKANNQFESDGAKIISLSQRSRQIESDSEVDFIEILEM
jgi:transcriptional regulator with XRE-family HTH domain